jgi:bacillopeptidase F
LKNNAEEVGSVFVGDDGKFAIPTELTEGANDFTAVSILDGRVTGESAPVSVILDTVNPSLTIDSPINGDKTNRETVTVQGSVDDANLESVKVNGQDAAVVDGKYSKRILLNTGANEITVVATDLAKNSISKTVTITAKYDAPVIENVLPSEDVILKSGKTVKIEFDSEPGLKSTFVIHMPLTDFGGQVQNATELPMMEESEGHYVGYWTAPKGTVANGAVIEVKAVDSFKNETRQTAAGKLYINVKSK